MIWKLHENKKGIQKLLKYEIIKPKIIEFYNKQDMKKEIEKERETD